MNLWKEIPTGPSVPEVIYAVIEIPKGSRNKYEYWIEFFTPRSIILQNMV